MNQAVRRRALLRTGLAVVVATFTSCVWTKMDPLADVDKGPPPPPAPAVDNSCWMATASNMLAGAGFGNGTALQTRADDIYADMVAQYGKGNGGWTDTALDWWLASANNTWTGNPYTDVTVYGNKTRTPWAEPNGARDLGNHLRDCCFTGVSISWPTATGASGGHAITGWGDNGGGGTLTGNPSRLRVTDSDDDTGGDHQTYDYDVYTNPNPGGSNAGNGWYFDYDPNHPFIKHIITLCPTELPAGQQATQTVVGSYKIHQGRETPATDLHYRVETDTEILSYRTVIDWDVETSPSIREDDPRWGLTVDWDLSDDPAPDSTWVTITTEFVLRAWNAIRYEDVYFTYPEIGMAEIPDISWNVESQRIERAAEIPNVSGGYVVGTFDLVNVAGPAGQRVAQYRFIHEHTFDQSPEQHLLRISGTEGYALANVRVGYSYGLLRADELWAFETWITTLPDEEYRLSEQAIEIEIDWAGRLPYPEGEDIRGRVREIQPREGLLRDDNP